MTPMEWSEDGRVPLFAAYAKAQAAMGEVFKKASNPAFKSKYADLASVVDAVMPAMNGSGLAVIQSPSFDGEIVSVETFVVHQEGGWIRSILKVRPGKPDAQGLGSAITYLRRYALLSIAGVAPEDDDGNAASAQGEGGKKFEKQPISEAARLAIETLSKTATMKDFKATWEKHREGWKGVLSTDDYGYVVKAMKTQSSVWMDRDGTKDAEPKAEAAFRPDDSSSVSGSGAGEVTPFDAPDSPLGDDEIPY